MLPRSNSTLLDGVQEETVRSLNANLSSRLYYGEERVLVVHLSADPPNNNNIHQAVHPNHPAAVHGTTYGANGGITQVDFVMQQVRSMLPSLCNFLYLSHARSEYGIIYIGKRVLNNNNPSAKNNHNNNNEHLRKMGAFPNANAALEMKQKLVRYFQQEIWPPLSCDILDSSSPVDLLHSIHSEGDLQALYQAQIAQQQQQQIDSSRHHHRSRLKWNALIAEKLVELPNSSSSDHQPQSNTTTTTTTTTTSYGRYFKITLQNIERLHFDTTKLDALHDRARWEERRLYIRVLDSLNSKAVQSYEEYETAFREACLYMLTQQQGALLMQTPLTGTGGGASPLLTNGKQGKFGDFPDFFSSRKKTNNNGSTSGKNNDNNNDGGDDDGNMGDDEDFWEALEESSLDWEFYPIQYSKATTALLPEVKKKELLSIAMKENTDEFHDDMLVTIRTKSGDHVLDNNTNNDEEEEEEEEGNNNDDDDDDDDESTKKSIGGLSNSQNPTNGNHVICNFVTDSYLDYGAVMLQPESTTLDYKSYISNTVESILERTITFMTGFLNAYGRGRLAVGVLELLSKAPLSGDQASVEFNGKPLVDQVAFGVDCSENDMKILGATLTAQCARCVPPIPPKIIHINAIPMRMPDFASNLSPKSSKTAFTKNNNNATNSTSSAQSSATPKDVNDIVQPIVVMYDMGFSWKDNFRAKHNTLMRSLKRYDLSIVHLPNFPVPLDYSAAAAATATPLADSSSNGTTLAGGDGGSNMNLTSGNSNNNNSNNNNTAQNSAVSNSLATPLFPASPAFLPSSTPTMPFQNSASSATTISPSAAQNNTNNTTSTTALTPSTLNQHQQSAMRLRRGTFELSPLQNLIDPIPSTSIAMVYKIIPLNEKGEKVLREFDELFADAINIQRGKKTTNNSSNNNNENLSSSSAEERAKQERRKRAENIVAVEYNIKSAWAPYNLEYTKKVVDAWIEGQQSYSYFVHNTTYVVDLMRFTQTNTKTGTKRAIRFIFKRPYCFTEGNLAIANAAKEAAREAERTTKKDGKDKAKSKTTATTTTSTGASASAAAATSAPTTTTTGANEDDDTTTANVIASPQLPAATAAAVPVDGIQDSSSSTATSNTTASAVSQTQKTVVVPQWILEVLDDLERISKANKQHCIVAAAGIPLPQLHLVDISVDIARLSQSHPLRVHYTNGKFFSDWPTIPLWDPITQTITRVERDYTLPLVEERKRALSQQAENLLMGSGPSTASGNNILGKSGGAVSLVDPNNNNTNNSSSTNMNDRSTPPTLSRISNSKLGELCLKNIAKRWRKMLGRQSQQHLITPTTASNNNNNNNNTKRNGNNNSRSHFVILTPTTTGGKSSTKTPAAQQQQQQSYQVRHQREEAASILFEIDGITRRILKCLGSDDRRVVRLISQSFNDAYCISKGRDIISMLLNRPQFAAFFANQRSMMPPSSMQHTVSVIQRHTFRIRQHTRLLLRERQHEEEEMESQRLEQESFMLLNEDEKVKRMNDIEHRKWNRPYVLFQRMLSCPSLLPLQLCWLFERGGSLPAPYPFIPVPLSMHQTSSRSLRPAPHLIPLYFYQPILQPSTTTTSLAYDGDNNNINNGRKTPPTSNSPYNHLQDESEMNAQQKHLRELEEQELHFSGLSSTATGGRGTGSIGQYQVAVVLDTTDGFIKVVCPINGDGNNKNYSHQYRVNNNSGFTLRTITGARCLRCPPPLSTQMMNHQTSSRGGDYYNQFNSFSPYYSAAKRNNNSSKEAENIFGISFSTISADTLELYLVTHPSNKMYNNNNASSPMKMQQQSTASKFAEQQQTLPIISIDAQELQQSPVLSDNGAAAAAAVTTTTTTTPTSQLVDTDNFLAHSVGSINLPSIPASLLPSAQTTTTTTLTSPPSAVSPNSTNNHFALGYQQQQQQQQQLGRASSITGFDTPTSAIPQNKSAFNTSSIMAAAAAPPATSNPCSLNPNQRLQQQQHVDPLRVSDAIITNNNNNNTSSENSVKTQQNTTTTNNAGAGGGLFPADADTFAASALHNMVRPWKLKTLLMWLQLASSDPLARFCDAVIVRDESSASFTNTRLKRGIPELFGHGSTFAFVCDKECVCAIHDRQPGQQQQPNTTAAAATTTTAATSNNNAAAPTNTTTNRNNANNNNNNPYYTFYNVASVSASHFNSFDAMSPCTAINVSGVATFDCQLHRAELDWASFC